MGFSHFEMSDCPKMSISGRATIRPDVVFTCLNPKVQPSVAACCCTPPHHTYMSQYPYLHTTDMHTCLLTVMLISGEQQANVGQWINTSLTPDPPDRQRIWGQYKTKSPHYCLYFSMTFRRSAKCLPPQCCVQICTALSAESCSSSTFKTFLNVL